MYSLQTFFSDYKLLENRGHYQTFDSIGLLRLDLDSRHEDVQKFYITIKCITVPLTWI